MKSDGRGRILKRRFGAFEARAMLLSAALHCLKYEDFGAYDLLMRLYKNYHKL